MNTQKLAIAIVLFILSMVTLSTMAKWVTPKQFLLGLGMTCLFGGTSILLFYSARRTK